MRGAALSLAIILVLAACAEPPTAVGPSPAPTTPDPTPWPDPPAVPDGRLATVVEGAVDRLVGGGLSAPPDPDALASVAASGDARLAWILADLLRFAVTPDRAGPLVEAFTELTGTDPTESRFGTNSWLGATNLLIGWDLPEPPGYRDHKAKVLLRVEPAWQPFFADVESTIDWRVTTWGGVFIDDSPPGGAESCSRGCIPALDDPVLTPATDGDWYPDERIVFGISVGDEAVALPKHIMEVHEMVNLTIGGRRLGVPYCTLCASAQAYLTDAVPTGFDALVLRTSGLLSRSNKLMYDLVTGSAFHTFTGRAASGPLREAGFVLEPVTVTVSTWGEWKRAHAHTTIVARDGGIGRAYPDDPLCGRDDAGPIFPIGPADTRLPAQAAVLGVVVADGHPIAFAADRAREELAAGRTVSHDGVELVTDGAGLRARSADGGELVAHEAFWFAWSQFHPTTALWAPLPGPDDAAASPRAVVRIDSLDGCQDLLDILDR